MKVQIKSLEWFEKNCTKYTSGYYYLSDSYTMFINDMLKLCCKVIEINEHDSYFDENGDGYHIKEWMYYPITEIRKEKVRLIKELIK